MPEAAAGTEDALRRDVDVELLLEGGPPVDLAQDAEALIGQGLAARGDAMGHRV